MNIVPGLEKCLALTAHFFQFSSRLYNVDMISGMLCSYSESTCDVK
jgi:hypothetical protein